MTAPRIPLRIHSLPVPGTVVNPLRGCTKTSALLSTTLVTKPVAQGMTKNAAAVLCLPTKALCFPVLLICPVYRLPTEPLTLQARLCCQHEVGEHFNGFWDFGLNGHKMVHVDSSTGEWTELDPGSRWMKELWEKNMHFTAFLKMTSQGDCMTWPEEFKSHWEEKLESA
ncbi:hypothetical protein U0070_002948, partial [Myodes glareolus]